MDLRSLFNTVSDIIDGDTRRNDSVDTDGLLGRLSGAFRQHGYDGPEYSGGQNGAYNNQEVLPASQDPQGDPADEGRSANWGHVRPASEDPLGDPADERR